MTNDTTAKNGRQVQKVIPIPASDLREEVFYLQRQGEIYAQATYLGTPPRAGKGKKQPLHDTKQQTDIRRAMKRLKGLIRANFGQENDKEAHITLTYQGQMRNTEKLQRDLEKFIKKLRYAYSDHKFEYIAVMEPHGHGGWHIHLLLKSNLPLWYASGVEGLSYNKTREMWRKSIGGGGNTDHERIPQHVDDMGKYFVMYFTTAIPEATELSGDKAAIKEASKAAVKGSRLKFYPAGFKFYRASMGIVRPKSVKVDFAKTFGGYSVTDTQAYAIVDEVCEKEGEKRVQYIQTYDMKNPKYNKE